MDGFREAAGHLAPRLAGWVLAAAALWASLVAQKPSRYWAQLLRRVFDIDAVRSPRTTSPGSARGL